MRHRAGRRQVRRWAPTGTGPAADGFADEGVYLVTGGAGGLAGLLADHLVARHRARLMLVGRSPAGPGLRRRMADWRERGGDVRYTRADVSTRAGAQAAAAAARETFGRVDGVLHCAGTLRDGLFFRKEPADLAAVCAAKVDGTVHLDAATAQDAPALFVLFSSLSAVLPNPGQADYAYANAFQLAFAQRRAAERPGRTLAVAWPLWADGGMRVADGAQRRATGATGMVPLPTRAGLELLDRATTGGATAVAVVHGDADRVPHLLPEPEPEPEPAPRAEPEPETEPETELEPELEAETEPESEREAEPEEDGVDDIAVIGLAGRYPGAPDLDTFWRNLAGGVDSIVEVPADRWDHAAYYSPDRDAEGRTYSRWGGFVDGVDRFHPAFFGISRRDAERMDPQERLFLTAGWHAFEDAGRLPRDATTRDTGVFVGVMWNHYQLLADEAGGVAPTAMHASVANRVSYALDLHGPSLAVDTACSSSLTALHLACESLRRGECDMALAGGVNVSVHPQKYLQLAQGQFLSADGRCRSFGAGGEGYVPGEGVGAVLLKPLRRARADGDHVHGVIRATVVNHTGQTSGFTVPSPAAQGELIRQAFARARWDPATVGYVEAHGTGTSLGDPIEVEGLRRAFADAGLPPGAVALGSVKSNIGHLESAAGIAGLTKVLLQLRHRELVPSLHAERTNPHIDFDDSPFRVQRERRAWTTGDTPRRAGISAFGAGGANAHVLVEEAPPPPTRALAPAGPWLFVLSARTPEELRAYAVRYLEFLDGTGRPASWVAQRAAEVLGVPPEGIGPDECLADLGFDALALRELTEAVGVPATPESTVAGLAGQASPGGPGGPDDPWLLADLAYTSQVGRLPMPHRLAVVTADIAELRKELRRYADGEGPGDHAHRGGAAAPAALDAVAAFRAGRLDEVAAHWAAGGHVRWADCHAGDSADPAARRRPMPGYPFREEVAWVGRWKGTQDAAAPAGTAARQPAVEPPEPRRGSSDGEAVEFRLLEPGIALLVMRDGGGSNMFTDAMMSGLRRAFARVEEDDGVRAVVLTGTDDVFSMGATPEGLRTLAGGGSRFTDVPFIYEGLLRCSRPVIAALSGHASGGGLAFGLYADLVVLARESVYRANFLTYGFTPGMGATHILADRFGPVMAAEMMYTGRLVQGEELERRGANVAFADRSDVLATALGLARSIAEKPAEAVQVLKQDLADRTLHRLAPVIERESAMHERVFGPESVGRIEEYFAKADGFRAARPAAEPVRPAVPAPAASTVPAAPVRTPAAPPVPDPLPPGPDEARISEVLYRALCESLYLTPGEVDEALSFSEMGLDSIGAVELVRAVNKAFGLDIDSVTVYDHPTVPRLVAHVRETITRDRALLATATTATATATAMATATAGAAGTVARTVTADAATAVRTVTADAADAADAAGAVRTATAPARVSVAVPMTAPAVMETPTARDLGDPGHAAAGSAAPGSAAAGSGVVQLPPLRAVSPAPEAVPTAGPAGQSGGTLDGPDLGGEPSFPGARAPGPTSRAEADRTAGAAAPPLAGAGSAAGTVARAGSPGAAADSLSSASTSTSAAASASALMSASAAAVAATAEPGPPAVTSAGSGDIAVIGMAGRFPDAPDLDAFWANLAAGRSSVREVPPERWDTGAFYDPDRRAPGRTYSKWAALLDGVDRFDPQFFRLSPLEAEAMDPQQRLFLEAAWSALEDAGHATSTPPKRPWGVFVGCAVGEYLELLAEQGESTTAHAFLGNSAS
ncbi:SDR family NAD(P)-dependent oxidoreductase, partial [Streptomyces sp. SID2955]|nr:SDR family NAD(P)-dependent oxidoreductase [Streptomyces sp. SID2955]